MNIKIVGIDLAKNSFQICALNHAGKVIFNKKVSRTHLANTLRQLPTSLIAMEACYSAHYWGRVISAMGHEVKLIPAQHVKPFVGANKNDAKAALAICEIPRTNGFTAIA